MAREDFPRDAFGFLIQDPRVCDDNSDNNQYDRLIRDPELLASILRRDPEKIARFHAIFETVDGYGSSPKRNPILGRAFVKAYDGKREHGVTCEEIKITLRTYAERHP